MSALRDPSGRPSDRVDLDHRATSVAAVPQAITGRECVVPGGTPTPAAPERPTRRGKLQLESVRRSLSGRDWQVLEHMTTYRYLTTSQLQQFCFADHATEDAAARICRRVLQRLGGLRVIEHLERRIGGVRAGSQSFVWRVGAIGDRLLRMRDDAPRSRRHEPSLRFLDHMLAVADCGLRLTVAGRSTIVDLSRIDTEPDTWRRYLGAGGSRETLKPDLYAVTATGEYEDHWFIEIDRGTESLPTVINKCRQYEACRRTGRVQTDIEVFPLVVWLTPDDERAKRIEQVINASRDLDRALYRVAAQADVIAVVTAEATS